MILKFNRKAYEAAPLGSISPKVQAIKAVRNATEFGLKESKDFVEEAIDAGEAVYTLSTLSHDDVLRLFRDLPEGFDAISSEDELAYAIEQSILIAVKQRNYKVAYTLIELLPHKLTGCLPGRAPFAAD